MKIGIDVSSLAYSRGVSRYTGNLIAALAELPNQQLYLYASSARAQDKIRTSVKNYLANSPRQPQLKIQGFPPSLLDKIWRFGFNPIRKQFPELDVFHSWDWLQPPDKNLPLVSTIHDLAIIKHPEVAHPKVLAMHQQAWEVLKKRNALIIAVSQATKNDIIKYLEIPERNVFVIHEALPTEISRTAQNLSQKPELLAKIKNMYQLERPYILFVGTREPRKNLLTLIKAWQPLANDYRLLVVGEQAWDGSEKVSHHSNLEFLGQVSDQVLAALYHFAELFAYPSLDEGFGLPVLEAFSYGVPVLAADIPVIREIAGNAADLCPTKDVGAMTEALRKILNEDKEAVDKRMKRMIIRLQLFNWQKTAKQTLAVYQRAVDLAAKH